MRAATGLHNPSGPIAAPDFGSALIAVGVWQAVFFIALRGWSINTITRRPGRLLVGNALVLGLGALTYITLGNLAHWQPAAIGAACGCVISAALIVAMLFEGWPAAQLPPAPRRAVTLALTALVALALNRALATYADGVHWPRATPDEWITTAALSFIGAGIILYVGIGLRWPFALKIKEEPMSPEEPTNPAVRRLVAAINSGDRDAFLAALTPDATLTDDGNPRSLTDWIDREIFSVHGHLTIEREGRARIPPARPIPQRHLGRDVHLLALPGGRGQDQPHRHRPGLSPGPTCRTCGREAGKAIQPTLTLGGPGPSRDESHGASRAQIWLIDSHSPPEASSTARHIDSAGRDRSAGALSFTLRDRPCS